MYKIHNALRDLGRKKGDRIIFIRLLFIRYILETLLLFEEHYNI